MRVLNLVSAVALFAAVGCDSGLACIQDDPPALHLTVRDQQTDQLLAGVTGTVTSDGNVRELLCPPGAGAGECSGWAARSSASIHVERAGYHPWDTTGVSIERTGGGCPRPVLKRLTIELQPIQNGS
jgi:hypothetical protein